MKYLIEFLILSFMSCSSVKKDKAEIIEPKTIDDSINADTLIINPELVKYEINMIHCEELWDYMQINKISTLDSTTYLIKNNTLYIQYILTNRGGIFDKVLLKNKKDSCYITLEPDKHDANEVGVAVISNAQYSIEIPIKDIKCNTISFKGINIEL